MANEMIPVRNKTTGDETEMPVESLEAWALKGWEPTDPNWRQRFDLQMQPMEAPQPVQPVAVPPQQVPQAVDAAGQPFVPQPPVTPQG